MGDKRDLLRPRATATRHAHLRAHNIITQNKQAF